MVCCFKYFDELEDCEQECQFAVNENDLKEFNGKKYCLFHLPVMSIDKSNNLLFSEKHKYSEEDNEQFVEKLKNRIEELCAEDEDIESSDDWNDFVGVIFPGDISYESEMLDGVNFNHCEFHGGAYFNGCVFKALAEFNNVIFYDEVSFQNCNFSDPLQFNSTVFERAAHFGFSGDSFHVSSALKEESKENGIDIDMDELEGIISQVENIPGGYFQNCRFKQKVTFNNRNFTNTLDFKGAEFHYAPEFYNCEFHQGTYFPSHRNFKDTKSEDAFHRYRVLKLAMENVRNHQDEAGFFTLEQRSLRKDKKWFQNYLSFSFLYDITSEYGINAARPLLLLLFFTVVFSVLYTKFAISNDLNAYVHAIDSSISNIVRPFQVWRPSDSDFIKTIYEGNIFALKLLMTLQTVICLSLITVFIVCLRWRFKRG